jgi:hypothetical protein
MGAVSEAIGDGVEVAAEGGGSGGKTEEHYGANDRGG